MLFDANAKRSRTIKGGDQIEGEEGGEMQGGSTVEALNTQDEGCSPAGDDNAQEEEEEDVTTSSDEY